MCVCVQALIKELEAMRAKDPTAKALCFTQFAANLKFLKQRLEAAGFAHRTSALPQSTTVLGPCLVQ